MYFFLNGRNSKDPEIQIPFCQIPKFHPPSPTSHCLLQGSSRQESCPGRWAKKGSDLQRTVGSLWPMSQQQSHPSCSEFSQCSASIILLEPPISPCIRHYFSLATHHPCFNWYLRWRSEKWFVHVTQLVSGGGIQLQVQVCYSQILIQSSLSFSPFCLSANWSEASQTVWGMVPGSPAICLLSGQ